MAQTAEQPEQKAQPEQKQEERVFVFRREFEGFLAEVGLAAHHRGVRPEGTRRIKELLRQEFDKNLV